jgi:16S rRNA (guanine527-N7)-methyltransferase
MKAAIIKQYFPSITEQQLAQFEQLFPLYADWNEKINLISRKDIDTLYEKHVLHSLAIAVICPFDAGAHILDVGTGGGFPGIPLAIFFPEVEFLLADSITKKIKVVQDIAQQLGLKNVSTRITRVEEITDRKFDYVVSRAVAPLADLWKWTSKNIRVGQKSDELPNGLICLKGGDLTQEIADSGLKKIAQAWSVHDIFPEPSFEEKYLIYVPKL